MMNLTDLRIGDVLLYHPKGWFSRSIAIKTWSDFSHCEMYLGFDNGTHYVYASRDPKQWFPKPSGGGVDIYELRESELGMVRRPIADLDSAALFDFVNETRGQKYDWWGLLRFFNVGKGKPDRMFCSECVTRALRIASGSHLFANTDADQVSPGMLAWTPGLTNIWKGE